jgi:imidazolonepropionase-like amidohydrolase
MTSRRLRPGVRRAVLALLALTAAVSSSTAARPRIYAITGATVVPAPGQRLEAATLVLRDGLIDAVGTGVTVPADAVTIDGKGMFVYAGLIDAGGWTQTDETPATGQATERSRGARREAEPGALYPIAAVRPERRAVDTLQAFEGDRKRDAASWRKLGFTALLAAPTKGIFRGSGALVLLDDDRPVADIVVRDGPTQHLGFETGGFGEPYPTSLMGVAATLRQVLLDAQRYSVWTDRYAKNPVGMPRPERLPSMEALRPVLAGTQPLFLTAGNGDDILLADRIAREFGVPMVAVASGTEMEVLDQIAKTGRTIIVPARLPDKPKVDDPDDARDVSLREMKRYLDAPRLPKALADAGVTVLLSAHGLKNAADFTGNVRKILEAGMTPDAALASLTTGPAKLLGVDRSMGTLEPGKIANVIVTDGPLFAKDAKVRRVFVDGTDYPIEEKAKPTGDPNAIVDPRGTWSVVIELGQSVQRTWTIAGTKGAYTGTGETRSGVVTFEKVELAGNALTVTFPASEGRGASEATVIITGDSFEGTFETGSRSASIKGTRTEGPKGGTR